LISGDEVEKYRRVLVPYGSMFQSPTHGFLSYGQVRQRILTFLNDDPDKRYCFVIGTDSQPHNGSGIDFVTAIVVHRVGFGGVYFWERTVEKRHFVLRQRMYQEAIMSLAAADTLLALLKNDGITKYDIEIHVDIGKRGETREMITEIIGMVRGNGWSVKFKPDSYAASKVADRYT
jgi:hypothetical protein